MILSREPGVGPKTAEAVLAYGYGEPGLPVDIHVCRVANRIVGSPPICRIAKDYDSIRVELKNTFSKADWILVHEILRLHGQSVCRKSSACCNCPIDGCCLFRKDSYDGSDLPVKYAANEALNSWEMWRELLLEAVRLDLTK